MSFDTYGTNNPEGDKPSNPQDNPSPYGIPPQPEAGNPYSNNSAPQGNPYQSAGQGQAPQNGFNIFGLTWAKNIVPNPATNGAPPMNPKSNVVAYILWFFLGWLGVHQFYLGNTSRGLFNLALWAVTAIVGLIGIPLGLVFFAYWVYEAVTLNDQTIEVNSGRLRKSIL